MSENLSILRKRIQGAKDLKSVIRTLKAIAVASITPYERAMSSLREYDQIVKLGLASNIRRILNPFKEKNISAKIIKSGAIIFGTDQGMVGQFNEHVTNLTIQNYRNVRLSTTIWAIGEHIKNNLEDEGISIAGYFETPVSVTGITALIAELLKVIEKWRGDSDQVELLVFNNRHREKNNYEPIKKRILPLDSSWLQSILETNWPNRKIPEALPDGDTVLTALIREYIFVSLYLACAESLSAESACRFAAMQNAETSVIDLIKEMTLKYNHGRQAAIDEELADLVNGFVVLIEKPLKKIDRR